jgi:ankyrin repeat protein
VTASNVAGSYTTTIMNSGGGPTGPVNTNSGSGEQTNNTIIGGSGNTQYNATNQYFHGTQVSNEDRLDEDFRKTLFLTSPEIDRENLIDTKEGRVSNTCEWIRSTKEYEAFLEGTHRMLWIWGEPGKGKTMLSIFLSQELEQKSETKTIYFFCRAEHEKRNTAIAVLRGLLWHLTGIYPELARVLRKNCEPAVKDALSSRETLWASFKGLIAVIQSERLYCVIDGLDECDESSQQWLARKFVSLHNDDDTSSCNVIVLSRYLVELKDMHQVNLDSDYTEQVGTDVKVFVEARTEELFQRITLSDTHRNELRERLFEGSQGSFLWVGFAMIDLLRQKNENGVMRALGRLPAGLFPLYDRMLRDVEADSKELSLCVLRSVALACRPLTLDELAFVASSRSAPSGPPITALNMRNLTEGCGPLFRIKENIVTLVHESVRDYTKEATLPDGLGSNTRKTHLQFAWACIDTLTREARESHLTAYARIFWPHHAIEADGLAVELFSHPSCFFAESSKLRSRWWSEYRLVGHGPMWLSQEKLESISQLHMACFLGIAFWAKDILNKQRLRFSKIPLMLRNPLAKRDQTGWTALHWAAYGGQVAAVELLLSRKAIPDARDKEFGRTALHWAADQGHEATVELLLLHMVNADAKDKLCGETALQLAAHRGHQNVAKMLLDCRANVNVPRHDGRTALHQASYKGRTSLVKLLVDHGADVHAEDENGATALYWATEKAATVKLLLDHGANANTEDNSNKTVLHMAASNQARDTIRLLLDRGADIKSTDNNGRNVLYYAFEYYMDIPWYQSTISLLLERHADINARNQRGQTALLKILEDKDSEYFRDMIPTDLGVVVRAMVKHGAQFDVESAEGKRILQLIREGDLIAYLYR